MYGGTKKDLLRVAVCRTKDLEKFRNKLKIGTTYELTKITTTNDAGQGRRKLRNVRQMRLIRKYPHIATFEDERGFLESFGYWELSKLIKGEEYV